ncbi:MAG: hypothetical protein JJE52_13145 [Acidimicrobiia bacterium]|nr:hypothetical protein [Acidimicrobiia bacterium]
MLTADPTADLERSLVEWRRFRERLRISEIHWIDALYSAYLTALFGLIAVGVAAGYIGDTALTPAQLVQVGADGPAWVGGVAAVAVAFGLRSGSRGGPLALERAEVRHVLLAPVDRATALRAPVLRQLRFLTFVAAVVGGIIGFLASDRFPGDTLGWSATGAIAATTALGLAYGAALVASGSRLPRWGASIAGIVLIAAWLAHAVGLAPISPTAPFGHMVLWPLRFEPLGLVPVVVAVVIVGIGVRLLSGTSLEAAERRSSLVGQMRFAATMQELRTVVVLRRQLSMELPRLRPWLRLRVRGSGGLPFVMRGLRGVLRWPAARIARLVLLTVVTGLALRGVWAGTTALIVLAGLAMFVAGLDAVEPLAQEIDHPSRRDSSPRAAADIHLRHLVVGAVVMVVASVLVAVVASVPGPGALPFDVAAALVASIALAGLGGAVISVLGGEVNLAGNWMTTPPEAQGMRIAFRTAWPPGVAVLGAAPVLLARAAVDRGAEALPGAAPGVIGIVVLFGAIALWVRVRDQVASSLKASFEQASAQRTTPVSEDGRS